MEKKKAVILDLDGTLVDSTSSGFAQLKGILAVRKIACTPEDELRLLQNWGMSTKELLVDSLGLDDVVATEIGDEWERAGSFPPMISGFADTLDYLDAQEIFSCVMTSRKRPHGRDVLKHNECAYRFAFIEELGGKEFLKPDARAFLQTLKFLKDRLGVTRKECLYVGDTIIDYRCGTAAGIDTLLVLTGACSFDTALEHKIHQSKIINSIRDLPNWMEVYTPR